jgi:hypothetical protein
MGSPPSTGKQSLLARRRASGITSDLYLSFPAPSLSSTVSFLPLGWDPMAILCDAGKVISGVSCDSDRRFVSGLATRANSVFLPNILADR